MANEIERKFIAMCDKSKVKQMATEAFSIIQTYLFAEHGERRVRKRIDLETGFTQFYYTEKIKISELKRNEKEVEISEEEYTNLLKEAEPKLHTIEKERYVIPFGELKLEIDFYPWDSRCRSIVEIEIPYEEFPIDFSKIPECIHIIRDVTCYTGFKNKDLAKTLAFPNS